MEHPKDDRVAAWTSGIPAGPGTGDLDTQGWHDPHRRVGIPGPRALGRLHREPVEIEGRTGGDGGIGDRCRDGQVRTGVSMAVQSIRTVGTPSSSVPGAEVSGQLFSRRTAQELGTETATER